MLLQVRHIPLHNLPDARSVYGFEVRFQPRFVILGILGIHRLAYPVRVEYKRVPLLQLDPFGFEVELGYLPED